MKIRYRDSNCIFGILGDELSFDCVMRFNKKLVLANFSYIVYNSYYEEHGDCMPFHYGKSKKWVSIICNPDNFFVRDLLLLNGKEYFLTYHFGNDHFKNCGISIFIKDIL